MKKVLIISTSPRHNSNSHALAEAFVRGAEAAGNDVEIVTLRDKDINFAWVALPVRV
ncbi:MAG: NAD(P)H-dependent oxidoreductase [Muribaculaceae bacterium]|nr:NAD(P)H-dependent oxidoreductase [Muribaculaceae bacterium]